MTTAAEIAFFDQQRRWITDAIRRQGVALTYVSDATECACCRAAGASRVQASATNAPAADDADAFGYTTGLYGIGHPELVIRGLDQQSAEDVLNLVAHDIRAHDGDLIPGQELELPQLGLELRVDPLRRPDQWVVWANEYYGVPAGSSVPALLLAWQPLATG